MTVAQPREIDRLHLVIPGAPTAWQRPRFDQATMRGFKAKKVRTAENVIRWQALQQMRGAAPISGPVEMVIYAVMQIPRSWSKKRQEAAIGAPHTTRPDQDNLQKLVLDALNGHVYLDDAQIWKMSFVKVYGLEPRLEVDVEVTKT